MKSIEATIYLAVFLMLTYIIKLNYEGIWSELQAHRPYFECCMKKGRAIMNVERRTRILQERRRSKDYCHRRAKQPRYQYGCYR